QPEYVHAGGRVPPHDVRDAVSVKVADSFDAVRRVDGPQPGDAQYRVVLNPPEHHLATPDAMPQNVGVSVVIEVRHRADVKVEIVGPVGRNWAGRLNRAAKKGAPPGNRDAA